MCLCFDFYWKINDLFRKGNFNVLAMYLHRYLRLTPLLAVCALMYSSILRYLGSGPLWPERAKSMGRDCNQFWWSLLLYAQNYVNPSHRVSAISFNILNVFEKHWKKQGDSRTFELELLFQSLFAEIVRSSV